ncbi:MAG TPA: 3-(3-hydroxy-phenyl)propionate transporter MhpT [Steroidobacteraceae bacterium]|jgi:AAHS family 3-hydroxyphenylpropionic acid transporter|nr:3-(3-hydroxy-phenyl)propionate transporter MhpT [Steroidobacteraceae bacterium]
MAARDLSPVQTALDGRAAMLTVFLCALGAIFEGVDLQVAGVAAAGIIPEFRPDSRLLGAFFSASTLGLVGGALLGGRMADRIGRKRVLITSVAVFGFFSMLTAYAPTMYALTWARLLTGLGLGGAFPIFVALTAESSAPSRRSSNVAIVYSAMPLGGALVSLLSMLIAPIHWRQLFIVGGVSPLLVVPVMARYLRESQAFEHAAAGVRASSARGEGFLAVLAHGRAMNTILLWVSFLLGLLTLYLLLNWLPTLLVGYGLDKREASFAQIAFNLGGAIAALCIGRLLDGIYRRRSAAIVFSALPILLLGLSLAPGQVWLIVSIVLVLGIVLLASQAVMYVLAPACYPTAIRGVGVGTAVAVGRVGSIIGPALAGVLLAGGRTTSQLFLYLVPITFIGGICALLLVRRMDSSGAS